jgi:hypothetical protein
MSIEVVTVRTLHPLVLLGLHVVVGFLPYHYIWY